MSSEPFVSKSQLLPDFCHNRGVLAVIVLAQTVAIVLAFAPAAGNDPWLRLGVISLFVHWISLLTLAVLCRLRPQLGLFSALWQGIFALFVLLSFTLIVSVLAWHFLLHYGWQASLPATHFIFANLLVALIVGLLGIQFSLLHKERNERIAAQSRAELDALQARIRPHFLFNSLNTAAELIHQDPAAAEQALLNLAALFRAAMQAGGEASLQDELVLAQQYLALERWRLGPRLQIDWRLPDESPQIKMPVLTLQPLFENAICHGIEPNRTGGTITIELVPSDKSITILICNTLSLSSRATQGNGIALANIRQRLGLMYQSKAHLHCSRTEDTFRVKLVLPKSEEEPTL